MSCVKRAPWFFAWLAFCAGVDVGGLWWLTRLRAQVHREGVLLSARRSEDVQLASLTPAASAENVRLVREVADAIEDELSGRRTELAATFGPVPARSVDGYFEIAATTERLRALAAREQVALKPDEHFGFAAYATEGPPAALLPVVHRQKEILQELLEMLFAAGPRELLPIQREAVGARPGSKVLPDYFVPDPRLVLKRPGLVNAWLFRLGFVGPTSVLRTFLNRVAAEPGPFLVRSVEVEPIATGPANGGVGGRDNAQTSLASAGLSKFTVVVEYADVTGTGASPAP